MPGGIPFAAMMAAAAVWAACYALELVAPSLGEKVLWAKAEYIGIVPLPLAWYLFARAHTGAAKKLNRGFLAVLGVVSIVTLVLVATNEWHGLVWSRASLSASDSMPVLVLAHGLWFWVHAAYCYLLLGLGSLLLLSAVYRHPQIYRQQAAMLLIAALVPWVLNVFSVFWIVPAGGIDLTPFAFTVTGIALAFSMSRFRLLKLVPALLPAARNQVLETMKDGVLVLDAEGRVVNANPAATDMLGERASEMIGKRVSTVLGDLSADRLTDEKNPDSQYEIHIGERESRRSYDVVSSPLGLGGGVGAGRLLVLRDITEREEAESALRASEDRYRQLFELESDAIMLVDDDSGQILEVNPAATTLYGYSREEWLSVNQADVSVEPDEMGRTAVEQITQVPVRWHRRKDGTVFPVEITGRRFNREGRSVHVAAIRDITERREAEQALKERDDQLRQSQKMEAIGQLAGGIAHDFNNLLTAIIGYADLILSSDGGDAESLRDDVGEIKAAADRASNLTRQILAFSRRQAFQPEVVSLNDIVTGTERLLGRTLGEDIELVTLLGQELGLVEVDMSQFEQVLMNLAVNARDAMPHGGKLTIETANVELSHEYCHRHVGMSPGPHVTLAVSDTGVGMDEETKERAFEPFFTTKEQGIGTGLGLSTVYGIVEQSGGRVSIFSEVGRGTTIKVYLPRASQPEKSRAITAPALDTVTGSETILLVEDETAVLNLAKRILESLGYRVVAAENGDDALVLLKGSDHSIDMLLTDVVLPGSMQGNELAQVARQLHPHLAVLHMSGYPRDSIVHAGRLDEGVNYLAKPFTPDELAHRVREVLDSKGVVVI